MLIGFPIKHHLTPAILDQSTDPQSQQTQRSMDQLVTRQQPAGQAIQIPGTRYRLLNG
jgi:hypothetical protein